MNFIIFFFIIILYNATTRIYFNNEITIMEVLIKIQRVDYAYLLVHF